MTKIDFIEKAPGYRKHLEESSLASNTVEKRKICVNEFIDYCQENNTTIETDDFYESVDEIRKYFESEEVNIHGTKVSAIRDFLEYIGTTEDSRTEDQLDDIKEKISISKMKGKNQDIGKLDKDKVEDKLLSDDEINAAKKEGSERAELLIELMLDTAARPGEIVAMTPGDVDFDVGSFHINSTWSDAKGFVQHNPKHDSHRRVKVKQSTLKDLQSYIESREVGEEDYVFPSYRSHVYRPIKKAFTLAQVRVGDGGKTEVTPHWLRHNAATRLIQNGNRKEKVQEYLGHSSVKITEVYEHFDDSRVVDVDLA